MFRRGALKFLRILMLRIRSINTKLKMKNNRKNVGMDLIKEIGDSEGLNVSVKGQKLLGLMMER